MFFHFQVMKWLHRMGGPAALALSAVVLLTAAVSAEDTEKHMAIVPTQVDNAVSMPCAMGFTSPCLNFQISFLLSAAL